MFNVLAFINLVMFNVLTVINLIMFNMLTYFNFCCSKLRNVKIYTWHNSFCLFLLHYHHILLSISNIKKNIFLILLVCTSVRVLQGMSLVTSGGQESHWLLQVAKVGMIYTDALQSICSQNVHNSNCSCY